MDKMVKQRRESIKSYAEAGRDELVQQEQVAVSFISIVIFFVTIIHAKFYRRKLISS